MGDDEPLAQTQAEDIAGAAYIAGYSGCIKALRARGFHEAAKAVALPKDDDGPDT